MNGRMLNALGVDLVALMCRKILWERSGWDVCKCKEDGMGTSGSEMMGGVHGSGMIGSGSGMMGSDSGMTMGSGSGMMGPCETVPGYDMNCDGIIAKYTAAPYHQAHWTCAYLKGAGHDCSGCV